MSHAVVRTEVTLNQNREWGPNCGVSWRQSDNSHVLSVHSSYDLHVRILVLSVHNLLGLHLHLGLLLIHVGLLHINLLLGLLIHSGLLHIRLLLGLLVHSGHLRLLELVCLSFGVTLNNFLIHKRLLFVVVIVLHNYY